MINRKQQAASRARCLLHVGFLLGLPLGLEDCGEMSFSYTGWLPQHYTAVYMGELRELFTATVLRTSNQK
jgi:hypothetical protein